MSDFTELYNSIRKDAVPEQISICGRTYTTGEVHPVLDPRPDPISLSTLKAVADYLNVGIDEGLRGQLFVRVNGPTQVTVESHLVGDFYDRRCFCLACPYLPEIRFSRWMDQDEFSIFLQACFDGPGVWDEGMPLNGKAAVLRYISRVTSKAQAVTSDDGTAQAVVVSSGIGSSAVSKLPNPVVLAPWRTFPEVEQPASSFVLRIQEHEGKPRYLLAEADGGAWRLEAVKRIAEWLRGRIAPSLQIPVLY